MLYSWYGAMCLELYDVIMKLHSRYNLPVYVTENGMSDADGSTYKRTRYIISHLQMMLKACQEGADIRGYYVWTLTDNFEWREGFRKEANFGLYQVDVGGKDISLPEHPLTRTPTPTVSSYTSIIRENGISASILKKYGSFPDIR
jgi:beta-glucosidase/6-phospho-beta-glucosidase/beta-galactosidase